MRTAAICLGLVTACTGCTALSLERHTLNQVATLTDLRFQQVLDNLAATAATPGILPAYAPIGEGVATVADTFNFDVKTLWQRATFKGFSQQTQGLFATFNPQPLWTIDPIAAHEQLEALQAAMKWAICGPPPPDSDEKAILDHFQVTRDLQALPPGWLGIGRHCDVPQHTLYRAHCHDTWVWVNKEGAEGFSRFVLIIQDIATVDIASLNKELPILSLKITYLDKRKNGQDPKDATTIEATVKKDVRALIEADPKQPHHDHITEIIASAPSGLELKEKNERFIVPSYFFLETSLPPNLDPQPEQPPRGIPTNQFHPSMYLPRSR